LIAVEAIARSEIGNPKNWGKLLPTVCCGRSASLALVRLIRIAMHYSQSAFSCASSSPHEKIDPSLSDPKFVRRSLDGGI
jgi:hypothetical protein